MAQLLSWRALNARRVLGTAAALNILRRLFGRRSPRPWLQQMAAEGLGSTPAIGWASFAAAGRCIGCGACAAQVPADLMAPAQVLMAAARQPADAPEALPHLAALLPHAHRIAAVCPTGVDVLQVHALVAAQAALARPGAGQ